VHGALGLGTLDRVEKQLQLALPADERGAHRRQPARLRRDRALRPYRGEHRKRRGLAFRDDGLVRSVLDRDASELLGQRADDDLANVGTLLDARGDVDDVAGDEELAGGARFGDGLTAVDAHARRELDGQLAIQLGELVAHRQAGPHGALGVVVVHARDTEHDHDRIADELLDGAAVTLGDRAHPIEIPSHRRPHELWIVLGAERGRPDGIGEQYRNELAFFRHSGSVGIAGP